MNATLTRKQFERHLAEITNAATRPVSKGARASVTVTAGRPHRVSIRVRAVASHRPAVLERLRGGRAWTEQLVRVWPCDVFVGMEPAGMPRLLESGEIAMEMQITGVPVAEG